MKRLIQALLILILLPIIFSAALYLLSLSIQPKPIAVSGYTSAEMQYIDPNVKYYLDANYLMIPGIILGETDLAPVTTAESYNEFVNSLYTVYPEVTTIHSLSEVRCDSALVDSYYDATLLFTLSLPSYDNYGIILPDVFCNMTLYINGRFCSTSVKENGHTSIPFSQFALFPSSDNSLYVVAITIHSPDNFISDSSDTILFGSSAVVGRIYDNMSFWALIILTFLGFCLIFFFIHTISLNFYKPTRFFAFLLIAFILNVLTQDCSSLFKIMSHIPYQYGLILKGLSTPLFMVIMVLLSYAMFPIQISKKIWITLLCVQIVPLINILCLGQFYTLALASSLIQFVPYALCMYIFVISYGNSEHHALLYGISVLTIESGSLLYYATQSFPVPVKYSSSFGILTLTIVQVIILSSKYSEQARIENFFKEELSRKLAEKQASENAFLNAQMKPHFLYNTLNTIADCCVTDSAKAKKLINSLSDYLKLIVSLDNMEETVPLSRELELVNAYSSIEKERFPSINFYQDFPFRLPDISMPPITIQPLIENAIKHGVRKLDKPGVITLRIIEDDEFVTFFVSDNGTGMVPEAIEKLFERPKENKSIGIYNIDKRLKNLYGEGLNVESTPGLGTCVTFRIPKFR